MRTLAVVNQKGGSGKTTTAVNLAAALSEKGKHVLVIDLDPQASASQWLGINDGGKGLFAVFTENGNLTDLIADTPTSGLSVIASSSWLIGAEKALAREVGAELLFRKAVRKLPQDRWDYALIDCPPSLGLLTVSALAAVDAVLIPVEAHVMALAGVASLFQTIEVVQDRLNPGLTVCGILACRVDGRTRHAQEVVEQLRGRFGNVVYKSVIRENVRIAEAPSFAQPITQYEPRSAGAEDYRALAVEMLRQEKRMSGEH
jgi:chromosome partitioning protein